MFGSLKKDGKEPATVDCAAWLKAFAPGANWDQLGVKPDLEESAKAAAQAAGASEKEQEAAAKAAVAFGHYSHLPLDGNGKKMFPPMLDEVRRTGFFLEHHLPTSRDELRLTGHLV